MKNKNILIALMALVAIVTSCMNDELEGLTNKNQATAESGSVITLTTDRVDKSINLSIDAPQNSKGDVWIDLNGDGIRAKDGSEDITLFNSYQDYSLAPGLNSVSVYGGITYLASASNELTSIDVSGNSYLTTLNVPFNRLSTLEISKNSVLKRLDCSNNNISALDISKNRALVSLWSFNNKLSVLNLSNNADLAFLDCSGNQLNSLDVSKNNGLVRLICYNNHLTSLDVSQNDKLNRLWIFGNSFSDREIERIMTMTKEGGIVDLWVTEFDNVLQ